MNHKNFIWGERTALSCTRTHQAQHRRRHHDHAMEHRTVNGSFVSAVANNMPDTNHFGPTASAPLIIWESVGNVPASTPMTFGTSATNMPAHSRHWQMVHHQPTWHLMQFFSHHCLNCRLSNNLYQNQWFQEQYKKVMEGKDHLFNNSYWHVVECKNIDWWCICFIDVVWVTVMQASNCLEVIVGSQKEEDTHRRQLVATTRELRDVAATERKRNCSRLVVSFNFALPK